MEEIFPIVSEEGYTIGSATRDECHSGTKLLHPVVHLHVLNSQNELLLQKRAANKVIQPSKWDTAVGGHVNFNEKIEDALRRETLEELNIKLYRHRFGYRYLYESNVEKELVYTYFMVYDKNDFLPQKSEIDVVRFWSFEEISTLLGKGVFTPNFELEFSKLKTIIK